MTLDAAKHPGGLAANSSQKEFFSPKEAAAFIADYGVTICEETLRERCQLSPKNPLFINTAPGFPGRHFIYRSELFRLLGFGEAPA